MLFENNDLFSQKSPWHPFRC